MRRILLFTALNLIITSLGAQNTEVKSAIKFRNFAMEHGLSMSSILQITQTKDGFLWIATPDKLNRFDGYEFIPIRHEYGNENTPSDNYITALLALQDGSLLVGTNSGHIDRYVNKYKKFYHYKIWERLGEAFEIRGFCSLDSMNVFAFTMGGGIIKLNVLSGQVQRITTANSQLPSNYVQAMIKVGDNLFAIGTDRGVYYYDSDKKSFHSKKHLTQYSISSLALFKGCLYAGTGGSGLFKIETEHEYSVRLGKNDRDEFYHINVMLADSKGNLWVGSTFDGLAKISSDGSCNVIKRTFSDNFSLINNTIYGIYEDTEGSIWIGTISGISVYMPLSQQFKFYRPNPENSGTQSKQIYPIYEDSQHQIWLGTLEGGVNLFDPVTESFTVFNRHNSEGLTSNSIRAIYQDSKGRYWIGTGEKGLFEFFPKERKFVSMNDRSGMSITHNPIRCLFEDKNEILWIGTTEGLVGLNLKTREVLRDLEYTTHSFPPQIIYDIKPGQNENTLWVASFGQGLFEFDIEKKKFIKDYSSSKNKFSNMNNNIMSIRKLGRDTLLLGTFGGGINILDLHHDKITTFSEMNGLPNDAIYGLLIDQVGNWWVSSNRGIACINPETKSVRSFDRPEQIQSLEFNEASYLASSSGLFLFGGIEGVNVFNPLEIKTNTVAPIVHISQMIVLDKRIKNIGEQELEFAYKKNFIGFDYVGIELLNPDKVTYSYMLEGVDEQWVNAGNRRFVQYQALRPGSYIFKVRAKSQDGIWSKNYASISFTILPPFWMTWWFIGLVVLAVLITLFGGYVYRVNKIRREFKTKVTEIELKALRSQMNPHFIFNSINSIQYYILNKNPQIAYSYLTKFSSLMRKILQNSRVNYISLAEELESLQLYIDLENIRIESELKYKVEVADEVNIKTMLIPSMVLQPFVENSIVHGLLNKEGEKRITLRVKKEISHIYCEIEDNGIGRARAKELNKNRTRKHESTAMKATKERLELLNVDKERKLTINIIDLFDEEQNPCGTLVQVFIPFIKE